MDGPNKIEELLIRIPRTGTTSIIESLRNRKINNRIVFAFARNPIDRFISSYFFLKKQQHNRLFPARIKESRYLKKFKNIEDFLNSKNIEKLFYFKSLEHFTSYSISHWGIFEKFEQSFDVLCKKLNVKPTQLKKINCGTRGFIAKKDMYLIKEFCKKDIEIYNQIKTTSEEEFS